jgi:hypothetical protein
MLLLMVNFPDKHGIFPRSQWDSPVNPTKVIVLNERHLRQVLHECAAYHNSRRSHQDFERDPAPDFPTGHGALS